MMIASDTEKQLHPPESEREARFGIPMTKHEMCSNLVATVCSHVQFARVKAKARTKEHSSLLLSTVNCDVDFAHTVAHVYFCIRRIGVVHITGGILRPF